MLGNKTLGLLLMVIGVVANNYIYLHDLARGEDTIFIGIYSWIGIVVSLVVIAVGLLVAMRANRGA